MTKDVRDRSRAYPVFSLEEASRAAREILHHLGRGAFARQELVRLLGHANAEGGIGARKVAALSQYGYLSRRAGRYSPTALAEQVARPEDESERRAGLQRALEQPPLFKALLERYVPQGHVPAQLAGTLCRDFGITRRASTQAAEVFLCSARYAGVLGPDGALAAVPAAGGSQRSVRGSAAGRTEEQRFELALTGGKIARLYLPFSLTERDLEIIKKQLEILELQVEGKD